ncbi:MAG: hypothetical protein HFH85_16060 [Lachnospiraceae bacterium]|nr:hypothetical protein [Lachnospiraceae bacterium]
MDLFKGIVQLIFDMVSYANLGILSALLLFYLVISVPLILIKLIKGVRRW